MDSQFENGIVLAKVRELCETIVGQPAFATLRSNVDTFMADEEARQLYQLVADKGDALHQKQHQGARLNPEEITDYEEHRERLLKNPVARNFLDAQQEMHRIQETVSRYVNRTLELGRVPEDEDFQSCGQGCRCGH